MNELSTFQQEVIKNKLAQIFERICKVYNVPSTTKELVNYGIISKIAREFKPEKGYYQWEQEKIVELLQVIDFTEFFANTKNTNSPARKVFFALKDPHSFLSSPHSESSPRSMDMVNFVKYILKKYCYILSNERLKEIFYSQLSAEVTPVQYELRLAILDVISLRTTFTKKISTFLSNEEEKREIMIGERLKQIMYETNNSVTKIPAPKFLKFIELQLIKSEAGKITQKST